MEVIDLIKLLMESGSTGVASILGGIAGLCAILIKWKKVDIESTTSMSRLQQDHLKSLMGQNKQLADDLSSLRDKMASTYDQIDVLRARPGRCDDCHLKV